MTPVAKLLLTYINYKGKMYVNHRGGFSIKKTPELAWLIKKGHLKQQRERYGLGKNRYTVLVPTNPVKADKVVCPCCKVDLTQHGAIWQTAVRGTSDYFDRAKHKYNCSIRIDHWFDKISPKRKERL